MHTPTEIITAEARLRAAGVSIDRLCAAAAVDRATWQRWKAGKTVPNVERWSRVERALAELASTSASAA